MPTRRVSAFCSMEQKDARDDPQETLRRLGASCHRPAPPSSWRGSWVTGRLAAEGPSCTATLKHPFRHSQLACSSSSKTFEGCGQDASSEIHSPSVAAWWPLTFSKRLCPRFTMVYNLIIKVVSWEVAVMDLHLLSLWRNKLRFPSEKGRAYSPGRGLALLPGVPVAHPKPAVSVTPTQRGQEQRARRMSRRLRAFLLQPGSQRGTALLLSICPSASELPEMKVPTSSKHPETENESCWGR